MATSLQTSISQRLRRRRFDAFITFVGHSSRPLRILDCGGTVEYWEQCATRQLPGGRADITIVNVFDRAALPPGFRWIVGDARDLSRFDDQSFDIAFSNSVINLMPNWSDQQRMAGEIRRVGRRYYVQAPNRAFPIDWRTLVPCFHFLPVSVQAWCFRHFRVGTYPRIRNDAHALDLATRVHDLRVSQMRALFPGCTILRERVGGLTKSIAAAGGATAEIAEAAPVTDLLRRQETGATQASIG